MIFLCLMRVWCVACFAAFCGDILGPSWWGEDQVGVLWCCEDGNYAATYDVRGVSLVQEYKYYDEACGKHHVSKVVQPFTDVLRDHLLRGYATQYSGDLKVADVDVSLSHVDLKMCKIVEFVSATLEGCLFEVYRSLVKRGRVHVPATETPFSPELCPWRDNNEVEVLWDVVTPDYACRALRQDGRHYGPTVFVVPRDNYVFRGEPTAIWGERRPQVIEGECLLHHKMTQASGDMERVYAFSAEKAEGCLNYQDGRILW